MNGLVLKRELVEEVGGFNEEYQIGEDIDLIMKVVVNGNHGRWLPYVGAYLRVHNDQSTNQNKIDSMNSEKKIVWERNLAKKRLEHREYEIGWKHNWDSMDEFEEKILSKAIKHPEKLMNMTTPPLVGADEIHNEMQRVSEMIGKELTPSEYEIMKGLTSGRFHEKTIHEIVEDEKLFLLKDDKELKLFNDRDIVI